LAARDEIRRESKERAERDPQDRHDMRMVALYVDLDSTGARWSRPCAVTDVDARAHIEEAIGDYNVACDELRDEVICDDLPKMAKARATMNPVPVLLEATWPAIEPTG
jgi:hypothetical protein